MYSYPTFTGFYHTGQVIIPVGVRSFGITIVSGGATLNNVSYAQGAVQNWQSSDSKVLLGSSVAVGATGVGNRVTVFYGN